jgi:hypothetical protein
VIQLAVLIDDRWLKEWSRWIEVMRLFRAAASGGAGCHRFEVAP